METQKPPDKDKDFWTDVRETVRDGVRELRNVGDELSRQGRLRVDIFQTERRLRSAYSSLGEATFDLFNRQLPVTAEDPCLSELTARIQYYQKELERLHLEQNRAPENKN